ncbi:MAG TPA: hypothetical protein VJL31_00045 [Gemmatimonadales bacterium]|nr:hypothetical protein [Gemmatimonadales bacterium]
MIRRDAPSASLLSQLPWLLDANSWALAMAPGSEPAGRDGGIWPLGNGRVFAHAGSAAPVSRLSDIVGPSYRFESFGDCWLELVSERHTVALSHQAIWRPRESGTLVTHAHDHAVSLVTIDYAPPGSSLLLRVVEIWRGDRLGTDARLVAHLPRGELHEARRRSLRVATNTGVLILSALAPGRLASPGEIEVPIGDVPASSGVQRVVLVLATGADEQQAFGGLPQLLHPITLLERTRAFWHTWLHRTHTPDLWPQNVPGPTSTTRAVADLIESAKVALKMQQADPGGGVVAMARRAPLGAPAALACVRALLAMGAREEARGHLEYQYRAAAVLGRIVEGTPPDLDTAGAGESGDFSRLPPPHPDTAASVILQHRCWMEAGGDAELVRRHWSYLRRCAAGHPLTPEGFVAARPGDAHPCTVLAALFPDRCGWPNDLVAEPHPALGGPWLLDTMAGYVAAQDAMAWMAPRAGHGEDASAYAAEAARVRDALERRFWMEDVGWYAPAVYPLSGAPHEAPCAPVNLLPLWLGYHRADDARARRNVEATVDLVGFRGSTPECEHAHTATAAYLAWDLTTIGADLAPLALANLVSLTSPAGGWPDVFGPGTSSGGLDPGDLGAALDAIYRYFTARRPAGEPTHELRGVQRDGRTFGPGPVRPFRMAPPREPGPAVVITTDPADVDSARRAAGLRKADRVTVIEPGLPFGPDFLTQLLFDPASGRRRVKVLMLGPSALAGDRRSMKPEAFWRLPKVLTALERFQAEGGRLVRTTPTTRDGAP